MPDLPAPTHVPLARLTPAPWNPRTIRDERFQNLCRSLEADPGFLELRPILATLDGTIWAGNMRYRAAKHLGWPTVPAILVDMTEDEAKRRALVDNGSWGEWEDDSLARILAAMQNDGVAIDILGFEDTALRDLLNSLNAPPSLEDPDAPTPPVADPISRTGDLWLLGKHRLLCGDSTNPADVARLMNGEKARLMATDPPYLVDYTGGNRPQSHSNSPDTREKHWDTYSDPVTAVQFYVDFIEAAKPHLEKRAPVYQWHADLRRQLVAAAWQQTGLLLHQIIIWVKNHGVLTRSHYLWQHEPCAYGWLQGDMPKMKPPTTSTTVWPVDQKGEQDGIHPTQKPVELFKRPILSHTKPGDLCYEPFSGSGTCIMAAEVTDRRCFAMEQEPAYVDAAVRRWEAYTGKTAERVPNDDLAPVP